jgi:hypothetical protein
MQPGDRFLIVRRGPLCVLRYDASEWVVHRFGTTVVHMTRVGFGFTRRAALRSMRRCPESSLPGGES